MQEVIVIGSVHKETGITTANELYKLLVAIQPNVIFEELHQSEFVKIYSDGGEGGLESDAVKMYVNEFPAKNIPVDLDRNSLIDQDVKMVITKTFNTFKANQEYGNLSGIQQGQTALHGFPFLNSNQHKDLMSHMKLFEAQLVKMINNDDMTRAYNIWLEANKKRELAMIQNINESQMNFKKAVFIVGSAHLSPIENTVLNSKEMGCNKFEWNFNYFGN